MHAARNRLYTSTAIPGGVDMISDRPWPAELTSGGMVLEPYGALQWSVLLQHTNRGGTTRLPGIQEEENRAGLGDVVPTCWRAGYAT